MTEEKNHHQNSSDEEKKEKKVHKTEDVPPTSPSCPKCGRPMTLRTAKQGAHKGNRFWGCSGYPKCRGYVDFRGESNSQKN